MEQCIARRLSLRRLPDQALTKKVDEVLIIATEHRFKLLAVRHSHLPAAVRNAQRSTTLIEKVLPSRAFLFKAHTI